MATYYDQLIQVASDYLGPAAKRFIDRQISFHFNKTPDALTKEDVLKLAESLRISLGLLTQDKTMVTEAEKRVRAIVAA